MNYVNYIPVVLPNKLQTFKLQVSNRPAMQSTYLQNIPIEDIEEVVEQLELMPETQPHIIKDNVQLTNENQRLLDAAQTFGVAFRVTSGLRPGAKTNKGKTSYHALGEAIDVTPIPGQTWNDLRSQIQISGFAEWLHSNGYRIIEETSLEDQKKYGATAANWHIGRDGMRK